MDVKKVVITNQDHTLYRKTLELNRINKTPNHIEDERSALDIAIAGAKKLPRFRLAKRQISLAK